MAKNAPGKHYRSGLTLTKLFEMFPDNATAEAWFAEKRWNGDIRCPHCGHDDQIWPRKPRRSGRG